MKGVKTCGGVEKRNAAAGIVEKVTRVWYQVEGMSNKAEAIRK